MNPYIQSFRLRTLPLSMSGIILGSGLAAKYMHASGNSFSIHEWIVFALAMCTTISLQILSNLCNELGDDQKGTDLFQEERVPYGLQAGTITVEQMKKVIWLFVGICAIFGTALIYSAFGTLFNMQSLGFTALGLLAIIGAVTYTLGKHSYGYYGLGDLGVFIFFGLVSTMGSFYLLTQTMNWDVFWSGVAIGLPCVSVLNLNNIRDMENDIEHGKRTFASLLGPIGARIYQLVLLLGSLVIFAVLGNYWVTAVLPVWAWHVGFVGANDEGLDKHMPILMITTFLAAILALI